ncbi:hypothetical protein [Streptomyces sp. AHA2]|uniref:hypothetical protein n=1 Tax=Streptomyces sp. AHA2 TaxID=3064526 RepID=UPI002FE2D4FB
MISARIPAAMLFVPSTGGFSHSDREHTADEHLVLGARPLLDPVVRTGEVMPPHLLSRPLIVARRRRRGPWTRAPLVGPVTGTCTC